MPHRLLTTWKTRVAYLFLGILIGGGFAWAFPSQHVEAYSSDRNDKFSVATALTGPTTEAVFVLDFLTGTVRGFALDRDARR